MKPTLAPFAPRLPPPAVPFRIVDVLFFLRQDLWRSSLARHTCFRNRGFSQVDFRAAFATSTPATQLGRHPPLTCEHNAKGAGTQRLRGWWGLYIRFAREGVS